ncbi:molybdopterin synthase sulfur carrier subunit [Chitinophaga caeni]|uniref:Molybdopterin synthase sulfur carrier subunit n=1 Tax=Chitinophaga caeni TaxID=2029983 RepID=A0A291QYA4_9BACT|nr:MoaD/ThiS family protein [Chitinophaga caeni]ATL48920.1 molybdopterin synthase sulfur carrier subunit [Chitinophaga caeni]
MKIKILAFGIVKDIFQSPRKELEIMDHADVATLKKVLEQNYPELKRLKTYFIAVDQEYATGPEILNAQQEIAIIPPVSGG